MTPAQITIANNETTLNIISRGVWSYQTINSIYQQLKRIAVSDDLE